MSGASPDGERAASRRGRRVLHIVAWGILGVALALYVGLPVAMAVVAVWPSHEAPGAAPAGFDNVVVRTADGVDLAAWYAPSRNGAALGVGPDESR